MMIRSLTSSKAGQALALTKDAPLDLWPRGFRAIGCRLFWFAFLPLVFVILSVRAEAGCWYNESVGPRADIVMMDVRWPWFNSGIYCANWNVTLHDSGGSGSSVYFYGGCAGGIDSLADGSPDLTPEKQDSFRGSGPWSFWGNNRVTGETPYALEGAAWTYFDPVAGGHEGSTCNLGGSYPWVKRNTWFTQLLRTWNDSEAHEAYVARWMKDNSNGEWHLLGVVRIPFLVDGIGNPKGKPDEISNAGFIEHFSGGKAKHSALQRRLGYFRRNGKWESSNTFSVKDGDGWAVAVKREGNVEYHDLEVVSYGAIKPIRLPQTSVLKPRQEFRVTVQQPAVPKLDVPKILEAAATFTGKQVAVRWEIPPQASPQLGWKVEVFNNPQCSGKPVAIHEGKMPQIRGVLIAADVANPGVRLSLTDVFDQATAPMLVPVRKVGTLAAAVPVDEFFAPGLRYRYFTQDTRRSPEGSAEKSAKSGGKEGEPHFWTSTAEIPTGKSVSAGISNGLDLSFSEQRYQGIAYQYEGFLEVPATGLYRFWMLASDAYVMKLNDKVVLAWDSLHGTMLRSCSVYLEKGMHPFRLDYCVDQKPFLKLGWEGPGFSQRRIGPESFFHQRNPEDPVMTLTSDPAGIKVNVEAKGQKVSGIDLYCGRLRLASTTESSLQYQGVLFEGNNEVFARLRYGNGNTMDTPVASIQGKPSKVAEGWEIIGMTDKGAPRGIHEDPPGTIQAICEGAFMVGRQAQGDFTLTCKVEQFSSKKEARVSDKTNVGLIIEGKDFGVYKMSDGETRTTTNFNDWGTSEVSSYELPRDEPWLRLVREGNLWMAWTSKDGKNWNLGAQHYIPKPPSVRVGVYFRDTTLHASDWFRSVVSNVSFVAGRLQETRAPASRTATGTAQIPFTGVVASFSDPNLVVLRSSQSGIMRSVDGGKTWNPANGNLPEKGIRSVAIDPTNPQVMYAAVGDLAVAGSSGLWKTTNSGAHWVKLEVEVDFDGTGPTAICSEVIAMSPKAPQIVLVGTETKGLWISRDGGKSWVCVCKGGERFVSVTTQKVNDNEEPAFAAATCPDRFVPCLGRGPAVSKTNETLATSYSITACDNQTHKVEKRETREDVGYLFVHEYRSTRFFGTTNGLETTYLHGNQTYLALENATPHHGPALAIATWLQPNGLAKFVAQPLGAEKPDQASLYTGREWNPLPLKGATSRYHGGVIAYAMISGSGEQCWVLTTNGLFRMRSSGEIEEVPLKP